MVTETEKLILDKLESMSVDLREVKDKTARIEDRVTGIEDKVAVIEDRVTGIENKVEGIEDRVTGIENKVAVIEDRVTGIENRVTRMELTIENDISKKIDIIGEGHDFLKQRLDEALQFEKKREGMELELINHRMEINKMKDRLDIA
ncbi:MAG: hypothetical protein KHX84_24310 [Enterocloster asparagiformis]|nr:hypothetical protein [Enterocloster asparagiformis]